MLKNKETITLSHLKLSKEKLNSKYFEFNIKQQALARHNLHNTGNKRDKVSLVS